MEIPARYRIECQCAGNRLRGFAGAGFVIPECLHPLHFLLAQQQSMGRPGLRCYRSITAGLPDSFAAIAARRGSLNANALPPAPIRHADGPIDAQPSVRGDAGAIPIFPESKHTQLRSIGDNRLSKHSRDLAPAPAPQPRDAVAPLESQPPDQTRRKSKHLRKQLRSIHSLASKIRFSFFANPETR